MILWVLVLALVVSGQSGVPVAANANVDTAATAGASEPTKVMPTANLANFKPGNIISDAVFFNKGTMTAAQIQSFLEAKVPKCQAGYTCLRDWYDTSRTTKADAMCGAYSGGTRERASTIIFKVAQACGINPQVILTTLQKEQALVTHVWPSEFRYRIAMGQGCPDTAACDTRYYGFFNQVYGAAWQFKRYANPPGTNQYFTWYAPGKTWNVRYHPNASCGSSPVLIENQATANLYYYTPYQPNAASLAAGYAAANNSCSSYGNRNFYNYFTDWFGSTQPPAIASLDKTRHVTALGSDGTLWAYVLKKDGRFGLSAATRTGLTGMQSAIAVGDLDGDGRRDVIALGKGNKPHLLRGDGAQGYLAPQPINVDWSAEVLITAAGDLDRDRIPDVLTTTSQGVLRLWRGSGNGGFRAPLSFGGGWNEMNLLSGSVDMTGDGFPDLIARHKNGTLYLYPSNGAGGWLSKSIIGARWEAMTSIFSPGDITGDGQADVLARDKVGAVRRYGGNSRAFLSSGVVIGSGWEGMLSITSDGPAASGVRTLPSGVGDLDGDRRPDVVARSKDGALYVYRGDGAGGWLGSSVVDKAWGTTTTFVTLGDFTSDGIPDLGGIAADGAFTLRRGNGTGGYSAATSIGTQWNGFTLVFGGLDFDGDRKTDVLARTSAGELRLYRGNGAGGWISGHTVVATGWNNVNMAFYAGDFDGDRTPDIIARRTDGTLWLYATTGSGKWRTPRQIGSGWADMTSIFSPGNFNGKAGPDVLARGKNGKLYIYRSDGKGNWISSSVIGTGWESMLQLG